ncbi:MAG: type III secretion system chaperone [Sulfitobacter sp.]|nr:type III secretion system chaperone [Sulfitobacter sp.]
MNENNGDTVLGDVEGRLVRIAETKLDKAAIEAVLAAFTQRNGLPAMLFDENDLIQFDLGEALDITLTPVAGFPGVLAMARLPEQISGDQRVLRELLLANLSFEDTRGGTFAKLPESETIAYCRMISLAEQDNRLFERELMGFAETTQSLIDDIELSVDLGDCEDEEAPVAKIPASFIKP